MSVRNLALVFIFSFLVLISQTIGQENQIVAGAGPSTEICKLFFDKFNDLDGVKGYKFVVMNGSVKHKGGILNSNSYLFGRTGRPLSEKERALGKEELILAKVPITFAKGLEVNVDSLSMVDITKIFTKEIVNWKDIGGLDAPIMLVGREQTEALFMTLKAEYPFFKDVSFDQTLKKDHEVMAFLKSPLGKHAIAFGAKPNFTKFNLLNVDGFASGVSVGLVYDIKNSNSPIVQLAKKYSSSSEWKHEIAKTSMLSSD